MKTKNMHKKALIVVLSAIGMNGVLGQNVFPTSGNVGIGTLNPSSSLQVEGTGAFQNLSVLQSINARSWVTDKGSASFRARDGIQLHSDNGDTLVDASGLANDTRLLLKGNKRAFTGFLNSGSTNGGWVGLGVDNSPTVYLTSGDGPVSLISAQHEISLHSRGGVFLHPESGETWIDGAGKADDTRVLVRGNKRSYIGFANNSGSNGGYVGLATSVGNDPTMWLQAGDGPIQLAAKGEIRLFSDAAKMTMNGDAIFAGKGTFREIEITSDRNAKVNITPIEADSLLTKLRSLPIHRWSYAADPGHQHIGPMAQDFNPTFGVGDTDKAISVVDGVGVSLAALQALDQKVNAQAKEMDELKSALATTHVSYQTLAAELSTLKRLFSELKSARSDGSGAQSLEPTNPSFRSK